jgi:hypothetical protein
MSLYPPDPDWDAPPEPVQRGERIAIVGSRDYPRLDLVRLYVRRLPPNTTVISGTRADDELEDDKIKDVDCCAIREAEKCGLGVQVFPAAWRVNGVYDHGAGVKRNTLIVEAADKVLAYWDGVSPGTADSIRKAKARGKTLAIIGPDGKKMEAK